ncbi:MAG: tRNA(Met) cytidine acetyltransferase, partial [Haemophilus parainfluenzae]|nr:tRNA(Met) cytidine acetyltransferase [Haemophilus parainfluenzae]
MTRHFQILISENMPSNLPANTLIINEFSKIQNLLGQEFETILFDARKGIHLEALAIAAGTLKMNGALIVLLSNWEKLHSQIDEDSLRWSGSLEAITTPRFIAYFKHCIHKYGFPVLYHQNDLKFDRTFQQLFVNHNATLDQQKIIEQILQKESELYFLTAKRGRGKSALAGLLANQLDTKIYLTAPNK